MTPQLEAALLRPEVLAAQSGGTAGRANTTPADHGTGSSAPEPGTLKARIEALGRQVVFEALRRHG